jgi:hypothetical protein
LGAGPTELVAEVIVAGEAVNQAMLHEMSERLLDDPECEGGAERSGDDVGFESLRAI